VELLDLPACEPDGRLVAVDDALTRLAAEDPSDIELASTSLADRRLTSK
jgi:hypothetical protein